MQPILMAFRGTAILALSVVLCGALAAQEQANSLSSPASAPEIRTVTLSTLRHAPASKRKQHAFSGVRSAPAGGISAPASPVSIVSTGAGALGLYNVSGDAVSKDYVTNHGGPLIVSTPIQLIFWGSKWPNAVNPSSNQVVSAVQSVLSGPYLSQMSQYGFQSMTLRGVTYVNTIDPNPNYASSDPYDLVWNLIDNGVFPEPDDSGGRNLYMVILPPGTTAPGIELGEHSDPWDYDFPADVDYAWVGWVGYGNLNVITKVLTHELVEAISDPEPDAPAWSLERDLNGGNEIGDACNQTSDFWNGILLQAYWSQQFRSCVLPIGSGRPEITSLSARNGPVTGGTKVVIQGRFLTNAQAVTFGGMSASSFTVDSMNQITAFAPVFDQNNGQRAVDVVVTTPFGVSISGNVAKFAYYPLVTSVTPSFGSMNGGEPVTITGQGFGLLQPTAIYFGGTPSNNVYCSDDAQCIVLSPPGVPGTVDVIASVGGVQGVPSPSDRYTYSGPVITSVDPAVGPEEGGTYVNFHGFGFDQSMTLSFGSTQSNYLVCYSATSCYTRSPAGKGTVHLTATVRGLSSPPTASSLYTYAAFPAILSVTPTSGPATGGTKVTISGLNFGGTPGATIRFGTLPAANVQCTTTLCTAITPAGSSHVPVTVNVSGFTSGAYQFSYIPVVTSVAPNKGSEAGGTSVVINGAGLSPSEFATYPTVAFGGNASPSLPICPTPRTCTVTSPAGTGVVDVLVTVDGQTSHSSAADKFTYTSANNAPGWTKWNLTPSDIYSAAGAMTYDPLRKQVLLQKYMYDNGGQTYTWDFKSQVWQAHTQISSPAVFNAALAFDESHGNAVLFGGLTFINTGKPLPTLRIERQTFKWDGIAWTALTPSVVPPARFAASMVYDAARNQIVMFGGCGDVHCTTLLNDTWTFDGVNWTQRQPVNSPSPRRNAALAYDPVSALSVLFGGETTIPNIYGDQWAWNGVDWIQTSLATPMPSARSGAALAYSRRDSGLVLWGGTGISSVLSDTWIWSGNKWTQVSSASATTPDADTPLGMAYDAAMDMSVLVTTSTWTWGGR